MQPIQKAFKFGQAALCLVNEWRDTLSYTAGGGYACAQILQGHGGWAIILPLGVTAREWTRSVSWFQDKQHPCLVGDHSSPVDHSKNGYAASFVTNVTGVGFAVAMAIGTSSADVLAGGAVNMLGGAHSYIRLSSSGTKLRDIPKLYFNKQTGMWDWPRKSGGNGPTQTDKLKNEVKKAFNRLTEKLGEALPRPTLVPVYVPVRRPRTPLPR